MPRLNSVFLILVAIQSLLVVSGRWFMGNPINEILAWARLALAVTILVILSIGAVERWQAVREKRA